MLWEPPWMQKGRFIAIDKNLAQGQLAWEFVAFLEVRIIYLVVIFVPAQRVHLATSARVFSAPPVRAAATLARGISAPRPTFGSLGVNDPQTLEHLSKHRYQKLVFVKEKYVHTTQLKEASSFCLLKLTSDARLEPIPRPPSPRST
eukprot:6194794-Pleurochrysis_carterae.AAC.1